MSDFGARDFYDEAARSVERQKNDLLDTIERSPEQHPETRHLFTIRSSYLFRLYWEDTGFAEVRTHAAQAQSLACAVHGRAEVISTCHRKFWEGVVSNEQFRLLV